VSEAVIPYQVSYSHRVLRRLKEFAHQTTQRGDGKKFAAAMKEFHRLHGLYPQFGEPFIDLKDEAGQIYKGFIRPLAMRYAVYEDRRLVLVGDLPVLLPMGREDPERE
jgi:hypothetical protein